jgi:hypothetical protein
MPGTTGNAMARDPFACRYGDFARKMIKRDGTLTGIPRATPGPARLGDVNAVFALPLIT